MRGSAPAHVQEARAEVLRRVRGGRRGAHPKRDSGLKDGIHSDAVGRGS